MCNLRNWSIEQLSRNCFVRICVHYGDLYPSIAYEDRTGRPVSMFILIDIDAVNLIGQPGLKRVSEYRVRFVFGLKRHFCSRDVSMKGFYDSKTK